MPPDDRRRAPFILADRGVVTIDRGKRGKVIKGVEARERYGADRVELYDGRVTLEYVRDGHKVREVYRLSRAEINASEPLSCDD
ncbi:MAG: hypothetical protein D6800_08895 [Candidatus Zixiibacteriota bacterium]|nr:MAG: hypothetical protein D6800_08895 [candidate division Zixibacteria bacterium]